MRLPAIQWEGTDKRALVGPLTGKTELRGEFRSTSPQKQIYSAEA